MNCYTSSPLVTELARGARPAVLVQVIVCLQATEALWTGGRPPDYTGVPPRHWSRCQPNGKDAMCARTRAHVRGGVARLSTERDEEMVVTSSVPLPPRFATLTTARLTVYVHV